MSIVPDRLAASTRDGLAPLARRLHAIGVRANAVTVVGALLTAAGAALVAAERPWLALGVLLVGTLADTLDGQLARAAGGGTRFGAFLDSTLDRVSDAVLAVAAARLGAAWSDPLLFWSALALLVASFLVSYMRAKAESLGARASVGLAPREARVVLYLVGLAAWAITGLSSLFVAAVVVAASLATLTALQRVAHAARELQKKEG